MVIVGVLCDLHVDEVKAISLSALQKECHSEFGLEAPILRCRKRDVISKSDHNMIRCDTLEREKDKYSTNGSI